MTNKPDPDQIANAIERELTRLVVMENCDPDLVLGQALALVFGLVASRHGGDVAAAVARSAADQCKGYPAFSDNPLAAMQPMGRA